ncbi:MAG: type II secretion system protein [Candidatus Levybacteria bacterium]|nr:type II secretion system protein [Candidatus Levybacteria bacterium]
MKKNLSSFTSFLSSRRGFTLVELAVVSFILVTLLGLITISLVRSQRTVSLSSAEDVLLADLRQQQLRSMVGDTEGRLASDSYGIHFDSNRYVLFHGSTYSISEVSNSTINLDSNLEFNSPGYDVIFSKLSGEIAVPLIIQLKEKSNFSSRRIHINKYGVVTEIESL